MQRHETDVVSLALAAIFVSIGAVFLSGRVDAFDFVTVWAIPVLLLAIGLVLAATALAKHRRSSLERGAASGPAPGPHAR